MKVFVPFSEALSPQLMDCLGLASADLVPFQLDYPCVPVDLDELRERDAETAWEVAT